MNRLFLLDGFALIYRAYYAFIRRPMVNTQGIDMSAVFGFTKTLIDLILKEKPTHIAVGLDPGGETFRHEKFPQYKANREETPEVIKASVPLIRKILDAFGIPVCMVKRYEADDVLGTIAKEAEKEGFLVYLVTSDKDYGQLVSPNIWQYKPGRSGDEWELLKVKEICEKYAIDRPEQVIDILAIQGDVSDNVPGVPGIGEVGAKRLVGTYKSVENLLNHLEELPEKQRNALCDHAAQLALSKELITICTSVPVDWNKEDFKIEVNDLTEVEQLFKEYEFGSLRTFIPALKTLFCPFAPVNQIACAYKEVVPYTVVDEPLANALKQNDLSFSLLFCQKSPDTLLALAICTTDCKVYWISSPSDQEFEMLGRWMESRQTSFTGHSIKPFLHALLKKGITANGTMWDTDILHYLLNPERSHRLEVLAQSLLHFDFPQSEVEQPVRQSSLFDLTEESESFSPEQKAICCASAYAAMAIRPILWAQIIEKGMTQLYTDIEMPLISVLTSMEREGIQLDIMRLKKYGSELMQELSVLSGQIRDLCGEPHLNISSPKQLGIVLFEKLQLAPHVKLTPGKQYATDEETLLSLVGKHPIIPLILEYRSLSKLLSTYIDPLPNLVNPVTGRIHTTFNQALTATGRLSSQKPNIQNIPVRDERGKELRRVFVPRSADHLLLSADYSQIELRIMAHLSQDRSFIEAFHHGEDIHLATAAKIFHCPPDEVTREQRNRAKTANFGIIYGISSFGLSQRLHISRAEAKSLIDEYFKMYPKVWEYIQNQINSAKESGFVTTLLHRRRYLPDIHSKNVSLRNLAERNAVNAPIQGSAADIIKIAMVRIARQMAQKKLRSQMILQVHDELVFDLYIPEKEELTDMVKTEMEHSVLLSVPLIASCGTGKHWLDAH